MNDTTLQVGQYGRIPLDQVIIGPNVRKTVILGADFLASVKELGVSIPVIVFPAPGEDGKFSVHDGQRRVLAAIDNNLDAVPAIVITQPKDEAARIIEQLVVNGQREGIIAADEASAITELDGLGITAAQMVKRTRVPKNRVEMALTVAQSPVASDAFATNQVSLEHAAALAEFEDDPAAVEQLTEIASLRPQNFDHRAQQLRSARARQAAIEALEQQLAAAGYRVISHPDSTMSGPTLKAELLFVDEKLKKRLVAKGEVPAPDTTGIAVCVTETERYEDGWKYFPVAVYVVEGWQEHGYHAEPSRVNAGGNANDGGGLSEEEKAKRKIVRDNNKLWQPATIVRRQWISELLQRNELPAEALEIAARYFGALPNFHYSQRTVLAELLGAKGASGESIGKLINENPKRSLAVLVAGVLTAIEGEQDFGKDGWRRGSAKAHLARLSKWGYPLSDIEQAVVAGTADKGVAAA